jgi:hypothetical protein
MQNDAMGLGLLVLGLIVLIWLAWRPWSGKMGPQDTER